jgi:hypothetical protein
MKGYYVNNCINTSPFEVLRVDFCIQESYCVFIQEDRPVIKKTLSQDSRVRLLVMCISLCLCFSFFVII